jgi:hypothetical protein
MVVTVVSMNVSLLMLRCAGPAAGEIGKRAVAGHCSLVVSGAFPQIGVSAIVIVVVHFLCSFDVGGPHCAAIQKAPIPLVDEGYTPYRGTTTVCPAKGLCQSDASKRKQTVAR